MITVFIRSLVLYIFVLIVMRLMGKREIGQFQPFEFAIAIMIADLASSPMQNQGITIFHGILPIIALLLIHLIISYANLKSKIIRDIVCGKPTLIIQNGKILEEELRNQRYNVNDLLEQLRLKNIFNPFDIEYAILENNGNISYILKTENDAVKIKDMKLNVQQQKMKLDVIVDGNVVQKNINKLKLKNEDLDFAMRINNLVEKDILIAMMDEDKQFFYQKKENCIKIDKVNKVNKNIETDNQKNKSNKKHKNVKK